MKKLFIIAAAAFFTLQASATEPTVVNEKVLQAFSKSFKDASNVTWHEYADRYEVRCVHNSIDSRITYDTNGNVTRTIRYYGEENLPIMLRSKLQKQYTGKNVFGVTEIATDGDLSYYIVLEDAKSWSHVTANAAGEMMLYKKYKKA